MSSILDGARGAFESAKHAVEKHPEIFSDIALAAYSTGALGVKYGMKLGESVAEKLTHGSHCEREKMPVFDNIYKK